jgi:hypothetical protein
MLSFGEITGNGMSGGRAQPVPKSLNEFSKWQNRMEGDGTIKRASVWVTANEQPNLFLDSKLNGKKTSAFFSLTHTHFP